MRCRKHLTDLSSSAGVCATCLRDRLIAIVAAQTQANVRKSDTQQFQQSQSISFHRSVSPHISFPKSVNSASTKSQFHNRFYNTPQFCSIIKKESRKSNFSSFIHGIFRSKSHKSDPDLNSNSSSWLSAIIPALRKKPIRYQSRDKIVNCANRNRGMSPVRFSDEEKYDGVLSGYSSESSQGWRQTPRRTPAMIRRRSGHVRSLSSLAFCLSPMVRPGPNLPENFESRVPAKPCLSTATSFCKSRSRKLADFGRHYYSTNY